MSLPEATCLALEIDISAFLDLSIDLPGGMSLHANLEPGQFPNLSVIVGGLLKPLNAALTPLAPFFCILDVIIKLIDVVKAIPDSLGPPPDPTKIAKALAALVKAAACLVKLIPPLSIPIMIVGICKVITAALLALVEELKFMITAQASLDIGTALAAQYALDPDLLQIAAGLSASIDCAQADLDLSLVISGGSLGPLNKFLDLLNAFMSLAGLPKFGAVSATGDPSAMLQPLEDAVLAIASICNAIPV